MKCWWLWHGGVNYAPPMPDDAEEFESIKDAKDEFIDRMYGRTREGLRTPCVDRFEPDRGGPEAWVFFTDPKDMTDLYPDMLIYFGPRGGMHAERCG